MNKIQSIYIGNGKFIQSTSNHKFLTKSGWKKFKDLSPEELTNIKQWVNNYERNS